MIRCVLGNISAEDTGLVLPHEHIVCREPCSVEMFGDAYYDSAAIQSDAVRWLSDLKAQYGLATFVDCTTPNLGRDLDLLKSVSAAAGVNIVASTGFYYGVEPMLGLLSEDYLAEAMLADIARNPIGVIKSAVEMEEVGEYQIKLLRAAAKVHLQTHLPMIVHSNANNGNGFRAANILLSCGVPATSITIGHLSDTENVDTISRIAELGCYIGLDRLGEKRHPDLIEAVWQRGYGRQMLLSHDELLFSPFCERPIHKKETRYGHIFADIVPELQKRGFSAQDIHLLLHENPTRMLNV